MTATIQERHLRNATLIDQEQINRFPVMIAGVGAIGSHLTEMLAKLGVQKLTLIDYDEIDEVNLGVQGFYETEVGMPKVLAVTHRIQRIDSSIEVTAYEDRFSPELLTEPTVIFSCVDDMRARRAIFDAFKRQKHPLFLDGRMAAEHMRIFTIPQQHEPIDLYQESLFPAREAVRESCTAKATIYCASMAAAMLCTQFKRWAMGQEPEPHVQFDLLTMDCFC